MAQFVSNLWRFLVEHWLFIVPLALGFVAVWLLLPQPRRRAAAVGVAAGVAALAAGGLVLLRATGPEVPWVHDVLFWTFAGFAVVAGVCMITQHNPVYAALWFALVILSTCGLFLLQAAAFLAAATIIVYAGAIIVTFLFVIMLAQQSGLADYDRRAREPLLATLAGFVLLGALLYVLQTSYAAGPADPALAGRRARLDAVVQRLDRARELLARPDAAVDAVNEYVMVSAPIPVNTALREEAKELSESAVEAVERALERWSAAVRMNDRAELAAALERLGDLTRDLREQLAHREQPGTLAVPVAVQRAQAPFSRPADGADAGHVTQVGRSLFGDYLWAVELAGTLLLAATIGAIVISFRQREEPS